MRQPLNIDEFARLARVPAEELDRYRSAGLLDPDGDGMFDDFDVLRLRVLLHYQELGYSFDGLREAISKGSGGILYSDLLFGSGDDQVPMAEAADRSSLDVDQIRQLRRAIGLPGGESVEEQDVVFLGGVRNIMEAGIPFEAVIDVARVYGDALRRLAETEVRMVRFYVDDPSRGDERERAERLERIQELLEPLLDPLVQYIHRQHLLRASVAEAVAGLESGTAPSRGAIEATIVFVDLASFTPLAQVHGDEMAAQVLERFDTLVREHAEAQGGSIVKQIGDAFMLTFTSSADAIRFAIALDEAAVKEPRFPAIRAGIHRGTVLYRVGDYVGNTVNLASRIAAIATANEILVTKPVAAEAIEADIDIEPAGEQEIRGFPEPVALYRIARTGTRATKRERDPVCGMLVGPQAPARLMHGGFEFAFCSEACLKRFLENPARYLSPEREEKPVL